MPPIVIKLATGRLESLKQRLAELIVKDVVAVLRVPAGSASLAIEEVAKEDWAEKVFRPEILNNPHLYQEPGYNPFD